MHSFLVHCHFIYKYIHIYHISNHNMLYVPNTRVWNVRQLTKRRSKSWLIVSIMRIVFKYHQSSDCAFGSEGNDTMCDFLYRVFITIYVSLSNPQAFPDSKVHGASMGPPWGRQDRGGPHDGPRNFALWVMLSWKTDDYIFKVIMKVK